jgi:DNA-binding response OmpR family regulator
MKKSKIIIIEDDPDLRILIALALRAESFEVTLFSEGNDFLREATVADLYIIDINLGGISGLDLCKQIKGSYANPSVVILISANPDIGKLAQEACADDTLSKPFNSRDLLSKVLDNLAPKYSMYG